MHKSLRNFSYIFLCLVVFSSCGSGYEHVLKSKDVNYKLTKANEYYDKKRYEHANAIYESLIPVMAHTRNSEPLYYKYAYSFYYMKDYLSASYHFKNFVDLFPSSKDADECEFMYGLCLFRLSPKQSLDQNNTQKALETLQSYINTHPNSKHVEEASKYIMASLNKLEEKDADAANLYYKIGDYRVDAYRSAAISYQTIMRNYPESVHSDYYLFMMERSWYKFAQASVTEKQEERYANAINAYRELVDGYPKSKYIQEAEKYYTLADNNLKKIRNEHK
jgi:outer membrane protein assembly factor BamD